MLADRCSPFRLRRLFFCLARMLGRPRESGRSKQIQARLQEKGRTCQSLYTTRKAPRLTMHGIRLLQQPGRKRGGIYMDLRLTNGRMRIWR
ncbi:MAG: hypothetical protein K0R28_5626 [Paenibacillus sp.]|jgi:hypothetical protein|nr:hypothetical protein [Paenibacillus sp.]